MAKREGMFPTALNKQGGLYWETVGSPMRDPRVEVRLDDPSPAKGDLGFDSLPPPKATNQHPIKRG